MINGNTEDFLDTGWFMEATLYYKGYIYWFEGFSTDDGGTCTFFVDKWRGLLTDDMYFHEYHLNDNRVDYKRVFEISGANMDTLKKAFLEAPIFEGKSFWSVESELIWVDEDTPIIINSLDEITYN